MHHSELVRQLRALADDLSTLDLGEDINIAVADVTVQLDGHSAPDATFTALATIAKYLGVDLDPHSHVNDHGPCVQVYAHREWDWADGQRIGVKFYAGWDHDELPSRITAPERVGFTITPPADTEVSR